MRKSILILTFVGAVLITFGQGNKFKRTEKQISGAELYPVETNDPMGPASIKSMSQLDLVDDAIGSTLYDLQTYNSLQHRMYTWPDGTTGVTWNMDLFGGNWLELGTGYNYFNGDAWGNIPPVIVEENHPSSSPNYFRFGENGEIIVSHYFDSHWKLGIYTRETRGEGNWEINILEGPEENVGIAWASLMVNGPDSKTLHILAKTTENPYMGQNSAFIYNRSSDGGYTWDIEHYYFEELGPNYLNNVGRDTYTWALPKGDTIAFTTGFGTGNGYVMKSYDNGLSWEKISVYENPFSPYAGGETPHFGAGDGTSAVALDSEGKAHVVFGRLVYYYDEEEILHYFPDSEGLVYWNEMMPMLDTTIVSSYTLDHLEAGGNLVGWATSPSSPSILGFGTYYLSLTTWPQMIIDEYDRIFVVYSGVSPYHHNEVVNYRHIFLNSSDDTGDTWNGIEDLNMDITYSFSECIFPSISPKIVDDKLRICFQEDFEVGLYVWIGQQEFPSDNIIRYMEIEVDSVVDIPELRDKLNDGISCFNSPNPFINNTAFNIRLHKETPVEIQIFDLKGQKVDELNPGHVSKGTHIIHYQNTKMDPGIYIYKIYTSGPSVAGKIVVR
jgi:hypothetical protein